MANKSKRRRLGQQQQQPETQTHHESAIRLRSQPDAVEVASEALEPESDAGESASPELGGRSTRRVSVSVDIHLASDSHFFSGLSGDISEGGLFVSTYRPLPVGSEVDLEFSLPGADETLHARGEVRWLREHSEEEPRGVGIAFASLEDDDRARIQRFCTMRPPLLYEDVG